MVVPAALSLGSGNASRRRGSGTNFIGKFHFCVDTKYICVAIYINLFILSLSSSFTYIHSLIHVYHPIVETDVQPPPPPLPPQLLFRCRTMETSCSIADIEDFAAG